MLLLVGSPICKKESTVDPAAPLVTVFHNISRADSTGVVIDPDSDDWKPITPIGMSFNPGAYPNPCRTGGGFVLAWHLFVADSVNITVNDAPDHVVETILAQKLAGGNYAVRSSMAGLQSAIYRVYFRIIRPDSTYVTFGDVQVGN